jgi:hypothetical protein
MNQQRILQKLEHMSKIPKFETEAYREWFEQKEFLQLLFDTNVGEIPLYISYKGTYIYSILLPQSCLKGNYIDDLLQWDCRPDISWGYSCSFSRKGKARNFSVSHPFDHTGSKLSKNAVPITFLRSFPGRISQKSYIEVYQLITHLHDLHFVEERNAYCRLNEEGDIEELIKLHYGEKETLVTIKQEVLDLHLFLTKSVLLRFFDRTLYNHLRIPREESRQESKFEDRKSEIYARAGIVFDREKLPTLGWLRGLQIIRNHQPRKKMIELWHGESVGPKKYEKFIAYDWKHKRIIECSCDPKKLGNYFVPSDKPLETSPVFFKPEVLLKYKENPEKYTLGQRSISCRSSWSLKTYDINEAGQVHTYLCYLGHLPNSEQLYWKSFNEKPKAPISNRAYKTDFLGQWDLSYEPLSELMQALEKLEKGKPELWSCTNRNLYDQLNYVVTDSEKEWSDEILTLDKLVVEGFNYEYLKKTAKSLNCFKPDFRSIKLLKEVLKVKKINDKEIDTIIQPLEEIQSLRTKFKVHRSGNEVNSTRKRLIAQHGNLKDHFRRLIGRVDNSIKVLIEIIQCSSIF